MHAEGEPEVAASHNSTLLSNSLAHEHYVKECFWGFFSFSVIFFLHPSQQPPYLWFSITSVECGGWDLMELAIVREKNKEIK